MPACGSGLLRVDLVGAGEEAGRSLRIAELERGAAGADQRVEILGIGREGAHVAGERRRGLSA